MSASINAIRNVLEIRKSQLSELESQIVQLKEVIEHLEAALQIEESFTIPITEKSQPEPKKRSRGQVVDNTIALTVEIIKDHGSPMALGDIWNAFNERGGHIDGDKPRNILSARLSHGTRKTDCPIFLDNQKRWALVEWRSQETKSEQIFSSDLVNKERAPDTLAGDDGAQSDWS